MRHSTAMFYSNVLSQTKIFMDIDVKSMTIQG